MGIITGLPVINDFVRAFSCAFAVTRSMTRQSGMENDPELLKAVGGLSSGISTMGDTCGAVNAGVLVLGKKFPDLPPERFYPLCAEFFRQMEDRAGTTDCGLIHGGNHLARNFRRAVLTGKPLKCMSVLNQSADVLDLMIADADRKTSAYPGRPGKDAIRKRVDHFESEKFHCCQTVIEMIGRETGLDIDPILDAARGFIGGIGFNGTVCGALIGGILCMGLQSGVNLDASGYRNSMRIVLFGLVENDRIFEDEKRFPLARIFARCGKLYADIRDEFGGPHCREILGYGLNMPTGIKKFVQSGQVAECRKIADRVVDFVGAGISIRASSPSAG